jgi:hypothetical protein
MFPYEYSVLLKAFKLLEVPHINVYLEAGAVADQTLAGSVQRVKFYYNKRFYKYTEENLDCQHDIDSQLIVNPDDITTTKTLFASEGCMLPSKSELKFANKGKFDLFTITNLSFMDLALYLKIKPNLYAVVKKDLADRKESVSTDIFTNFETFSAGDISIKPKKAH